MKAMFLTGATGFVGGESIKRYIERAPSDLRFFLLVRAPDEARLEKRKNKFLKTHFGENVDAVADRFTFVRGDLLKERWISKSVFMLA